MERHAFVEGHITNPRPRRGSRIFTAKSGAPEEPRLRRATNSTITWSCLKGDFDDVFKIFADLLQNPEFRAGKIEIATKGADDAISRRNDQIGQIARRESAKLAYGADNPYVREPEYATIADITRQDLIYWAG